MHELSTAAICLSSAFSLSRSFSLTRSLPLCSPLPFFVNSCHATQHYPKRERSWWEQNAIISAAVLGRFAGSLHAWANTNAKRRRLSKCRTFAAVRGQLFEPSVNPRLTDNHYCNWYWYKSSHPGTGREHLQQSCVPTCGWIKVTARKWTLNDSLVLGSSYICESLQPMTVALTSHQFGVFIWQHKADPGNCKQAIQIKQPAMQGARETQKVLSECAEKVLEFTQEGVQSHWISWRLWSGHHQWGGRLVLLQQEDERSWNELTEFLCDLNSGLCV